jgi:hypothetical protein
MKAFTDIRDDAERILEDSGNALWSETILDGMIRDCLREMSSLVPLKETETVHARDDSYELDISGLTDVLWIDYAEWEIDQDPLEFHNVRQITNNRAIMEVEATPSAHADGQLTGTITFSDSSKAISGSGTAFTTELEVGDWIKKSSSATWHRVAFIADTTNLTLATEVATADDGADTADKTDYWHSPVRLHCAKVHRLNEMTTLTGVVNLTAGYANDIKSMVLDTLQSSGTIKKGTKFTISDTDGIYTITADATISSNAATIYFYPGLATNVVNDEVLTFETSTLTEQMERLLAELVAAKATLYWLGRGRTQLTSGIDALDMAAGEIAGMSSEIGQAITDIDTGRTATGLIATSITTANTQFDLETARIAHSLEILARGGVEAEKIGSALADANTALDAVAAQNTLGITDLDSARTELAKADDLVTTSNTPIGKMDAQIELFLSNLMEVTPYINSVHVGDQPAARQMQLAKAFAEAMQAYRAEAAAYIMQAQADESISRSLVNQAMGEFAAAGSKLNEARGFLAEANMNQGAAATFAQLALGEIRAAQEYRQQGLAYLQEGNLGALAGRTYAGIGSAELSVARAEMNQAIAHIRELMGRLSSARTIMAYRQAANQDLGRVRGELQSLAAPRYRPNYAG